jgi:hypothetical protein
VVVLSLLIHGCHGSPKRAATSVLPRVQVVVKNGDSVPIQDAHLWLKDAVQDVPVISPESSATVTINPPPESNLHFEFRRGEHDWRHCVFLDYARLETVTMVIDKDGNCAEYGLEYPSAVLTRSYDSPLAPPGLRSRPPYILRDDGILISGYAKAGNLDHAPAKGLAAAAVKLVEFCDFADAECAQNAHIADQLFAAYPRQVQVLFKHDPRSQISWVAHEAAVAAGDQGKFWPMHDLLYADQSRLSRNDLLARARQLRLNLLRFEQDLDNRRFATVVEADHKEGPAPRLFIGPYCTFTGAKDLVDFKRIVMFVLKESAARR